MKCITHHVALAMAEQSKVSGAHHLSTVSPTLISAQWNDECQHIAGNSGVLALMGKRGRGLARLQGMETEGNQWSPFSPQDHSIIRP